MLCRLKTSSFSMDNTFGYAQKNSSVVTKNCIVLFGRTTLGIPPMLDDFYLAAVTSATVPRSSPYK